MTFKIAGQGFIAQRIADNKEFRVVELVTANFEDLGVRTRISLLASDGSNYSMGVESFWKRFVVIRTRRDEIELQAKLCADRNTK